MKVVIQRSLDSSVEVENNKISSIDSGMVILVGFTHNDTISDIDYMVKKIINLRIFDDEFGVMNKSIIDVKKEILCISQFTLYANTVKGNRPSFSNAMKFSNASVLYDIFCDKLNQYVITKKGKFGSDMKVNLINDGPVT